jgi:hypothetical protein
MVVSSFLVAYQRRGCCYCCLFFVAYIRLPATKICSFSTQNFGVNCATVVPVAADDNHFLVGYQTGYMESWKIFRFSTEKIMTKLLWRGVYPNSYCIQNMAPLMMESESEEGEIHPEGPNKSTKTTTRNCTAEGKESSQYLLVTVLSPKHTLKTSAMVEVLDLQSIAEDWKHRTNGSTQEAGYAHGHLKAVNLGSRWVMPGAGMEILNSSTLNGIHHEGDPSETLPRRVHVVPSTSTGSICTLPQGNCVALADGTIALLSATTQGDDKLRWGIANDYNQLLLPYPAIGCAPLNWEASLREPYIPHVACCLRGGTTYLIPFFSPDETDNTLPVTTFSLDVETQARHVVGFTAGNLIMTPPKASSDQLKNSFNSTTTSRTTPVLVYGYAGGVIDIYSCELQNAMPCRPMITHRERSTLEELVSNGSIQLLAELLGSLEERDSLLAQSAWKQAWIERNALSESTTVTDLLLANLAGTRTLLLQLSENSNL